MRLSTGSVFFRVNANYRGICPEAGRITPSGVITEFAENLSADSQPYGIKAGPDGNIWFTEKDSNRIGRVSEITTGCMATLDGSLVLQVPYLFLKDPMPGSPSLWCDFVYQAIPEHPMLMPLRLTGDKTLLF